MSSRLRFTVIPLCAGLVLGLMCLAQAGGVFVWMPETLFFLVHQPAFWVSGLLFPGERALLAIPVAIVGQWLLVGWAVGAIVYRLQRCAQTPG